jgi:hypothetical protein
MNLKKKKIDVRMWTGFIWLRIWTSEHGNEFLNSVKGLEFLE